MAIKNKEAIEKVLAMQEKLIPKLEKLDADGVLTSDVAEAAREAGEWDYQYENRNRLDLEPRRWEPHKLARLLHKHISDYPRDIKRDVQEYCYAVEKMGYDADRAI